MAACKAANALVRYSPAWLADVLTKMTISRGPAVAAAATGGKLSAK